MKPDPRFNHSDLAVLEMAQYNDSRWKSQSNDYV